MCAGEQRTVGVLPLWILSVFFSQNDIPKLFHFSSRKWRPSKMIKTRNGNTTAPAPPQSSECCQSQTVTICCFINLNSRLGKWIPALGKLDISDKLLFLRVKSRLLFFCLVMDGLMQGEEVLSHDAQSSLKPLHLNATLLTRMQRGGEKI